MKTVEQATSRFAADLIDLIKANIRARLGPSVTWAGAMAPSDQASGLSMLLGYNTVTNELARDGGRYTVSYVPESGVTLRGTMANPSKAAIASAEKTAHAMGLPKPRKPVTERQLQDAVHASLVLSSVHAAGKQGIKTNDIGKANARVGDLTGAWVRTLLKRLLKSKAVKRIGRTRGTRWVATGAK